MAEQSLKAEGRVLVAGAGLVGSLLANFLARRGYQVDVYERRSDMRREKIGAGKSINLAVSARGLHALAAVGLERRVLELAVPMRGRMIHPVSDALVFQPYGSDDSECINSISRAELNCLLMDAAEKTGSVRFHFGQKLVSADGRTGQARFQDEAGAEHVAGADLLIGADGAHSALRAALVRAGAFPAVEAQLDYGYKELHIPAAPGGGFQLEKNALHIWPRGNYMLIALPNQGGSYTCTLFLPFEGAWPSFERLRSAPDVRRLFVEQFSDTVPLLEKLESAFFEHPIGNMVTVKCPSWRSPEGRALLLGDAAHAIVPFFGQGMNAGFEDCVVLDALLERHGSDWPRVCLELEGARRRNTDAIADMAVENFVEMRDKVGSARFLLEKEVEKKLELAFPGEFLSRYRLVSFTRAPYRVAQEAGKIGDGIIAELCGGIERPAQVDLARARELILTRLKPYLEQQGLLGRDGKWILG